MASTRDELVRDPFLQVLLTQVEEAERGLPGIGAKPYGFLESLGRSIGAGAVGGFAGVVPGMVELTRGVPGAESIPPFAALQQLVPPGTPKVIHAWADEMFRVGPIEQAQGTISPTTKAVGETIGAIVPIIATTIAVDKGLGWALRGPKLAADAVRVASNARNLAMFKSLAEEFPTLARGLTHFAESYIAESTTAEPTWKGVLGFAALDFAMRSFPVATQYARIFKRPDRFPIWNFAESRWMNMTDLTDPTKWGKAGPFNVALQLARTTGETPGTAALFIGRFYLGDLFKGVLDDPAKRIVSGAAHYTTVVFKDGSSVVLERPADILTVTNKLALGTEVDRVIGTNSNINALRLALLAQEPDEVRFISKLAHLRDSKIPVPDVLAGLPPVPKNATRVFQVVQTGKRWQAPTWATTPEALADWGNTWTPDLQAALGSMRMAGRDSKLVYADVPDQLVSNARAARTLQARYNLPEHSMLLDPGVRQAAVDIPEREALQLRGAASLPRRNMFVMRDTATGREFAAEMTLATARKYRKGILTGELQVVDFLYGAPTKHSDEYLETFLEELYGKRYSWEVKYTPRVFIAQNPHRNVSVDITYTTTYAGPLKVGDTVSYNGADTKVLAVAHDPTAGTMLKLESAPNIMVPASAITKRGVPTRASVTMKINPDGSLSPDARAFLRTNTGSYVSALRLPELNDLNVRVRFFDDYAKLVNVSRVQPSRGTTRGSLEVITHAENSPPTPTELTAAQADAQTVVDILSMNPQGSVLSLNANQAKQWVQMFSSGKLDPQNRGTFVTTVLPHVDTVFGFDQLVASPGARNEFIKELRQAVIDGKISPASYVAMGNIAKFLPEEMFKANNVGAKLRLMFGKDVFDTLGTGNLYSPGDVLGRFSPNTMELLMRPGVGARTLAHELGHFVTYLLGDSELSSIFRSIAQLNNPAHAIYKNRPGDFAIFRALIPTEKQLSTVSPHYGAGGNAFQAELLANILGEYLYDRMFARKLPKEFLAAIEDGLWNKVKNVFRSVWIGVRSAMGLAGTKDSVTHKAFDQLFKDIDKVIPNIDMRNLDNLAVRAPGGFSDHLGDLGRAAGISLADFDQLLRAEAQGHFNAFHSKMAKDLATRFPGIVKAVELVDPGTGRGTGVFYAQLVKGRWAGPSPTPGVAGHVVVNQAAYDDAVLVAKELLSDLGYGEHLAQMEDYGYATYYQFRWTEPGYGRVGPGNRPQLPVDPNFVSGAGGGGALFHEGARDFYYMADNIMDRTRHMFAAQMTGTTGLDPDRHSVILFGLRKTGSGAGGVDQMIAMPFAVVDHAILFDAAQASKVFAVASQPDNIGLNIAKFLATAPGKFAQSLRSEWTAALQAVGFKNTASALARIQTRFTYGLGLNRLDAFDLGLEATLDPKVGNYTLKLTGSSAPRIMQMLANKGWTVDDFIYGWEHGDRTNLSRVVHSLTYNAQEMTGERVILSVDPNRVGEHKVLIRYEERGKPDDVIDLNDLTRRFDIHKSGIAEIVVPDVDHAVFAFQRANLKQKAPTILIDRPGDNSFLFYLRYPKAPADHTRDIMVGHNVLFFTTTDPLTGKGKDLLPAEVIEALEAGYDLQAVAGPIGTKAATKNTFKEVDRLQQIIKHNVVRIPPESMLTSPSGVRFIFRLAYDRGYSAYLTPEGVDLVRISDKSVTNFTEGGSLIDFLSRQPSNRMYTSDPLVDTFAEEEARRWVASKGAVIPDENAVAGNPPAGFLSHMRYFADNMREFMGVGLKWAKYLTAPGGHLAPWLDKVGPKRPDGKPIISFFRLYTRIDEGLKRYLLEAGEDFKIVEPALKPFKGPEGEKGLQNVTLHIAHYVGMPDELISPQKRAIRDRWLATTTPTEAELNLIHEATKWYELMYPVYKDKYRGDQELLHIWGYVNKRLRRDLYEESLYADPGHRGTMAVPSAWQERTIPGFGSPANKILGIDQLMIRYAADGRHYLNLAGVQSDVIMYRKWVEEAMRRGRGQPGSLKRNNILGMAFNTLTYYDQVITGGYGSPANLTMAALSELTSSMMGKGEPIDNVIRFIQSYVYGSTLGFRAMSPIRNSLSTLMLTYPVVGARHTANGIRLWSEFKRQPTGPLGRYADAISASFMPQFEKEIREVFKVVTKGRTTFQKGTQDILELGMWGMRTTENMVRGQTYFAGISAAQEILDRAKKLGVAALVQDGKATKGMLNIIEDTSFAHFDPAVREHLLGYLDKAIQSSDFERDFLVQYAGQLVRHTMWAYGPLEAITPGRSRIGRLMLMYGTWPANYIQFMLKGLLNGKNLNPDLSKTVTPYGKRFIARWMAVNLAGASIFSALGIYSGNMFFHMPADYSGGPFANLFADAYDVWRLTGNEERMARARALRSGLSVLAPAGTGLRDMTRIIYYLHEKEPLLALRFLAGFPSALRNEDTKNLYPEPPL